MRFVSILALAAVSACTAANVQTPQPVDAASPSPLWSFTETAAALRAASCPDDVGYLRAQSMDIQVIEAERGPASAQDQNLTGLSLAGAWQLKSEEPNFGGLSGLDVLRSGSLLAVTDAGAFTWLGIDPESGVPDGIGAIAYMRDQDGNYFANKRDGDAEGLSVHDGIAFVSFEQDHRVSAFDLERCGAGARAAPVATLEPVVGDRKLASNSGPEALAFVQDALRLGFEFRDSGGSPLGMLNADGSLSDLQYTEQSVLFVLTGMDERDGLSAKVFRAYDPIRGPRIILHIDRGDKRIAEAVLKQPLPVDNFEGVALAEGPDGSSRVWLISDDNFNLNQRTLLLALDLDQ